MTDSDRDRDTAEPEPLEDELERTRKLILERRNRFMAAALAGIGMAGGQACTRASVCLSFPAQAGNSAGQTGGGSGGSGGTRADGPCPGQPWRQPPCVCLSAPMAGHIGPFGGTIAPPIGGTSGAGGAAGSGGTRPNVCLSAPIDAGLDAGPVEDDAGTDP